MSEAELDETIAASDEMVHAIESMKRSLAVFCKTKELRRFLREGGWDVRKGQGQSWIVTPHIRFKVTPTLTPQPPQVTINPEERERG